MRSIFLKGKRNYEEEYKIRIDSDSLWKIYSENELIYSDWPKGGGTLELLTGNIQFSDYAKQNLDKCRDGYTDQGGTYHPGWNEDQDGGKLWTWANRIPVYCLNDRHDFNGKIIRHFHKLGYSEIEFYNLEP